MFDRFFLWFSRRIKAAERAEYDAKINALRSMPWTAVCIEAEQMLRNRRFSAIAEMEAITSLDPFSPRCALGFERHRLAMALSPNRPRFSDVGERRLAEIIRRARDSGRFPDVPFAPLPTDLRLASGL